MAEEKKEKICPWKDSVCTKEDCAIYDKFGKRCAVLGIQIALYFMEKGGGVKTKKTEGF